MYPLVIKWSITSFCKRWWVYSSCEIYDSITKVRILKKIDDWIELIVASRGTFWTSAIASVTRGVRTLELCRETHARASGRSMTLFRELQKTPIPWESSPIHVFITWSKNIHSAPQLIRRGVCEEQQHGISETNKCPFSGVFRALWIRQCKNHNIHVTHVVCNLPQTATIQILLL